ncbi:MAG: hypothetical protein ACSHX7_10075 [Luteolibacter sp.]
MNWASKGVRRIMGTICEIGSNFPENIAIRKTTRIGKRRRTVKR